MSQAQLIRIIELEKQTQALNERIFRLETAVQNLPPPPKEREWPTSRKS